MKILIVEDEELAVKKLTKTINTVDDKAEIVGVADSIRSTIDWLESNPTPDLILMDIELADGQSFEVFNLTKVKSPVIFTTSYDEYALQAFKVNSIDYLLKPVNKIQLEESILKYQKLHPQEKKENINIEKLDIEKLAIALGINKPDFMKRFIVRYGEVIKAKLRKRSRQGGKKRKPVAVKDVNRDVPGDKKTAKGKTHNKKTPEIHFA